MPYFGGPTFLAKALSFVAGILCQEQSFKKVQTHLRFLPTPKHDRPQVIEKTNKLFVSNTTNPMYIRILGINCRFRWNFG